MTDSEQDIFTPAKPKAGVFWALLLIAVVVGAGVRLYGLNGASLWIDEIYTVRDALDAGRPTRFTGYIPTRIVLQASGFKHPDISPQTLHTWREQGLQPWHIRLGPAIIGIFSIPLLALALRRAIRDDLAAGFFAVLLSFAPWHLFWSQLGRYYTLKFLILGLAFCWYYRGTRQGKPMYVLAACVMLYIGFLVHNIALGMGLIFLLDIGVSYLRGKPIRIGKAGWLAAGGAVVAAGLTYLIETSLAGSAYKGFLGNTGQSPPLVVAGAFFMIQLPVLLCAGAGILALRKKGDSEQAGLYWLLAGSIPIAIMAVLALKTFSQARYAFDSLFGFLVLASIGCAMAYRAMVPHTGRVLATVPLLMILSANLLLIAQHHTTGYHLHRDWVSAFDYVLEHKQEGENVVSQRPEIASYYLGIPVEQIQEPPGRRYMVDEIAEGKPLWVVDLGASSIKNHPWKHAKHADLRGVFPTRVWQPYSELHVYLYDKPRPREVWEAEKREAEAQIAVENQKN